MRKGLQNRNKSTQHTMSLQKVPTASSAEEEGDSSYTFHTRVDEHIHVMVNIPYYPLTVTREKDTMVSFIENVLDFTWKLSSVGDMRVRVQRWC